MQTREFKQTFQAELRNPEYVREYLRASLQDAAEFNDPGLVQVALLSVMQANRSVSRIAREAGLSRPALYRALETTGNPEFATIFTILRLLGMRFSLDALPPESVESADSSLALNAVKFASASKRSEKVLVAA